MSYEFPQHLFCYKRIRREANKKNIQCFLSLLIIYNKYLEIGLSRICFKTVTSYNPILGANATGL